MAGVSSDFKKFFAKNQTAINDVKKAEARVSGVPLPVGLSGVALVTNMKFDKWPDKKDQASGTLVEGFNYCEMELRVTNDPKHQGKVFKKQWTFRQTAKWGPLDWMGQCFDDLENIGLPRELRENFEDPQQLVDFFMKDSYNVCFNVVANNYTDNKGNAVQGKQVNLDAYEPNTGTHDNSVAPPETKVETTTTPVVDAAPPVVGAIVKYLGREWTVKDSEDGKVVIVDKNSKTKTVDVADLEK
jgi:hypothetical protein